MGRRLFRLVAVAVAVSMLVVPASALANHDEDQNGLVPIVPFHHDGDPAFYISEGETLDVGTRWGACTKGLVQSFIPSADVEFSIDNIDGGSTPSYTAGSWSAPVNPPNDVIGPSLDDLCKPNAANGTGWWTFWVSTITFDSAGVFEVFVGLSVDRTIADGFSVYDGIDAAGSIIVVVLSAGENPGVSAELVCDGSVPVLTVTNDGNEAIYAQIEDDPELVDATLAPGETLSYDGYEVGEEYTWQAEYPIGTAILDFGSGEVEACS